MIGMPGYLPNSNEVFAGKSESSALDYALACADFNLALSRRARRKLRQELRSFGETVLSDSPYEVIWLEEISQQEYENDDNWLDSFATLE